MVATVSFLFALSFLIFIHEFGHYLAARWARVQVMEFNLGLGPKAFGFQRGETRWNVRWLPLGGSVILANQLSLDMGGPVAQGMDPERTLESRSYFQRLVILSAGCAMNVLFAWALLWSLLAFRSEEMGIPREIGMGEAFVTSTEITGRAFQVQFEGMVRMMTPDSSEEEAAAAVAKEKGEESNILGPVGIARESGRALQGGAEVFLLFLCALSIGLAWFNLMPIPVLDGGRIGMLLVEAVRGRGFSVRAQTAVATMGVLFIMGLFLTTLVADLTR